MWLGFRVGFEHFLCSCYHGSIQGPTMLAISWLTGLGFLAYLESHVNLVSRLIMGIIGGLSIWIIAVIKLLTQSL